ncbi:type III-B CRISPR module RAMP protein Cmr6 [Conchiformibius kuhniae]|uniref:Type III-B CRISPR module RAMP protein Cmr6 n=1 Tax=Conchiformibius kuhniae TaxID=211502 RepID=A0A8T9MXI3_9NEIS|nr:type III-B CRISPR module RAMP protein Cmr6 [Conchiformibius kuhniae]UOP04603.1 type III-B CRISPR module RAMP protein Cmr6 [Conchiformibius kuhniae]
MCELMRESLRELTKSCRDAHAGLLLQRGLQERENKQQRKVKQEENQKLAKEKLLDRVASVSPSEVYKLAFNRWVRATADENRFTFLCAEIVGRLYIGLNSAGALETGICTQHSYGMPFLPGSSVKGAVRHYAENVGLPENICKVLFGGDDGDDGVAGALVWHDAWWIPVPSEKPFVGEVVTVHHQDYYRGKDGKTEADEMESPVPNQQIATQGSFYFVVEAGEGATAWAEFARQLLGEMLAQQGMGAKTASGYGYFAKKNCAYVQRIRMPVAEIHRQKREQQDKAREQAARASLSAEERTALERTELEAEWQQWQNSLFGKEREILSAERHQADFDAFIAMLNRVCTVFTLPETQQCAADFSLTKLEKRQPHWLNNARKTQLRAVLSRLRGEAAQQAEAAPKSDKKSRKKKK